VTARSQVIAQLAATGVPIVSRYLRDPDQNLVELSIELSNYRT
jgi:hypothetical protein